MHYDPEANIISWQVAGGKISHAWEFSNFIIHVSSNNKPILIEILEASRFIGQMEKLKNIKDIKKVKKEEKEGLITYNNN